MDSASQHAGGPRHRPAKDKTVQKSRHVAYRVLRAVSEDDAYANLALPAAIAQEHLSQADAALATELTYGTLRMRGTYDAIIAQAAKRPVLSIEPGVLDALRLGAHQLLAMRVAEHAAVNESVNLAATQNRGATGFANAVLRAISRRSMQQWQEVIQAEARSDDEKLSLEYAHPVWVIRAFRRALAAEGRGEELLDLLAADNQAPEVTLVALPGLAEVGEPARPYAPTAFGAPAGDPYHFVKASGGTIRVQDEGSQLVALALTSAKPITAGERWLDLCAGPGGKSALLAAVALETGAELEANEVMPKRAGLVRQALAPVPLRVPVHEEDGRDFARTHPQMFDRILVDAPCTGLGALRRRPEARWRKQPTDVPNLVSLQEQLLEGGLQALAPDGILAYVTCSPHLAETTGVLNEVLRHHPEITQLDAAAALNRVAKAPLDLGVSSGGQVQLWPHRHGTDAMFIALLQRRGESGSETEAVAGTEQL